MGQESGMPPLLPEQETLVVNTANPLVQTVLRLDEDKDRKDDVRLICRQVYDLALLRQRPLSAEGMQDFVARSLEILSRAVAPETQKA
jgi:molecular chaperone HtpG